MSSPVDNASASAVKDAPEALNLSVGPVGQDDDKGNAGAMVSSNTKTFPLFSKFPQEIQDLIWEHCSVPKSPCVQAVALHITKPDYRAVPRLALPRLDLARYSHAYHARAQVGMACSSAAVAAEWMELQWELQEAPEVLRIASDDAIPVERLNEGRTVATIHVPLARNRRRFLRPGARSSQVGESSTRRLRIHFHPQQDMIWLDCPFEPVTSWWIRQRTDALPHPFDPQGNLDDLLPVQHLALEFDEVTFGKKCSECEHLASEWRRWGSWVADQRLIKDDPSWKPPLCVLCAALDEVALSDLDKSQKWEARKWLAYSSVRAVMEYFWRGGQDIAELRRRLTTANAEPNEPHDPDSLQNVLPLLSRVYSAMKHIQGMIPEEGDDPFFGFYRGKVDACEYEDITVKGSRCMCEAPGCPGHFTWEQVQRLHKPAIVPWEFEKTGKPICYAGEPKPGGHERSWGGNADLPASFWPNIIPHLKTQYLIDRRIKLRPGARIPPGARTFRGNGSLLVEVPFPANRELERGGQDDVWVYPEAGRWGENAFDLARYVREMMMKRSHLPRIPQPVYYAFIPQQPEQTSLSVAVPETRVLTIIE